VKIGAIKLACACKTPIAYIYKEHKESSFFATCELSSQLISNFIYTFFATLRANRVKNADGKVANRNINAGKSLVPEVSTLRAPKKYTEDNC